MINKTRSELYYLLATFCFFIGILWFSSTLVRTFLGWHPDMIHKLIKIGYYIIGIGGICYLFGWAYEEDKIIKENREKR